MMVQLAEKKLTLDEFLKLPETKPASEYIDGQIIQKLMPQGKHSRIQGKLVNVINAIAEDQQIALAFPELRCTYGSKSIVPDVVVLKYDRIPRDEDGDIANVISTYPDWVIEILSPAQSQSKVIKKILSCLDYGSQLGWLIDPEDKFIFVYYSQKQPQCFEEDRDLLPVPEFLGELQLTLGDVFGWLKI
jgi:Uma2 family endonuclease